MASILHRKEELRLYNQLWYLSILDVGLKVVSSNASLG
jgi:hypothetical protein